MTRGAAVAAAAPPSLPSPQILVDGALAPHHLEYARVDSGGNRLAPVSDDPQLVPIPSVAARIALARGLVLGVGAMSPYAALARSGTRS